MLLSYLAAFTRKTLRGLFLKTLIVTALSLALVSSTSSLLHLFYRKGIANLISLGNVKISRPMDRSHLVLRWRGSKERWPPKFHCITPNDCRLFTQHRLQLNQLFPWEGSISQDIAPSFCWFKRLQVHRHDSDCEIHNRPLTYVWSSGAISVYVFNYPYITQLTATHKTRPT